MWWQGHCLTTPPTRTLVATIITPGIIFSVSLVMQAPCSCFTYVILFHLPTALLMRLGANIIIIFVQLMSTWHLEDNQRTQVTELVNWQNPDRNLGLSDSNKTFLFQHYIHCHLWQQRGKNSNLFLMEIASLFSEIHWWDHLQYYLMLPLNFQVSTMIITWPWTKFENVCITQLCFWLHGGKNPIPVPE